AAAGGIGLWAAAQASRQAPPRLEGTRARAEEVARAALRERGALVDGWTADVTTTAGDAAARAYVWSEAPGEFERLEGAWFGAPRWIVRFADWSAPPEQRAEEYRVWIGVDGAVARVQHLLPEGAPGARLDAEAARALALEAVRERLGLEPAELRVVEADEESRPERSDWTFELVRRGLLDDVPAEARVRVSLAGDEVVDVARYVRVPESWERERRRTGTRTLMLRGGLAALLAVGFGAAAVAAVVAWSRRRLPMRAFRRLSAAAAAAALLWAVTAWPAIGAGLSTAQPRRLQVVAALTVLAILVAIAVPAVGLVGALASGWLDEPRRGRERSAEARPDGRVPLVGAAWGLLLGGALDAMRLLAGTPPPTARVAGAAAGVPLLDGVAAALPPWLVGTAGLLWLLGLRARHGSTAAAQGAGWGLFIAVAVASVPEGLHGSLVAWAAAALVTAAVLRIGFRALASAPAAAPLATAALLGLQLLELSWTAPYPGARAGGFLALATLTAAALAWSRELEEGSAGRSDPVAGEARLGG
ncbi:MAG TPA: hypothetical protein VFQ22_02935, partial [Longimicrobiales bacterium]|nr:hypothetical protein [Longimicrobiales bacterium]